MGQTDFIGLYHSIDLCYKIIKGDLMKKNQRKFKSYQCKKPKNIDRQAFTNQINKKIGLNFNYSKKILNNLIGCF